MKKKKYADSYLKHLGPMGVAVVIDTTITPDV